MFEFLLILALLMQSPSAVHLPGGTVTGVLRTQSGAPMVSVRVAVMPADLTGEGGILQAIVQTDADGRYRIENVPPGRYHIMTGRLDNPTFHPGVDDIHRATTIVVSDGSTTQVAEMLFVRTRISGRVVDAASGLGRRIESLSICCDSSSASSLPGSADVLPVRLTTQVNDDGSFEFSSVPAGNLYFQVFDPKIVAFNFPIAVTNADDGGIELKVSSGSEIRGRLVDQTGTPIGQAQVSMKPLPGNTTFELRGNRLQGPPQAGARKLAAGDIQAFLQFQAGIRMFSVGVNGVFNIPEVLPGTYLLEISPPGSYSVKHEIVVGSQAATMLVELPFTQVAGKVVVTGDGAKPSLKDSIRAFMYAADGRVSFCLPDEDGRFYQVLPPGKYRVEAQSLSSEYSVQSISDGVHDLSTEPYILERAGPLEIRVTIGKRPQQ